MSEKRDLVVLAADGHQEMVLKVLLARRRESLGLRPVTADIFVHQGSDPGVYRQAHEFLRPFLRTYHYALVVLDVRFPGSPNSADGIVEEIHRRLVASGWQGRAQVIAIDPELEAWVWSDSPHVEYVLGKTHEQIRRLAEEQGWWLPDAVKPVEPKKLLLAVLREKRRPPSSAVFGDLASQVSLKRCSDGSFTRLRETLQTWFDAR